MGKGGETIKAICAQSGAHCQVDKTAPEGAREKSIVIKVCSLIWWKSLNKSDFQVNLMKIRWISLIFRVNLIKNLLYKSDYQSEFDENPLNKSAFQSKSDENPNKSDFQKDFDEN